MRKIWVLTLITLLSVNLKAQSVSKESRSSIEASIGLSKVGFNDANNFFIDRINCFLCGYQEINKEGYEFSFQLTVHRKIRRKSEIYFGLGLNLWLSELDNKSGSTGESLGTQSQLSPFTDLIGGYRYIVKEFKSSAIFIGTSIHGELNTTDFLNQFKLSVEPAIGLKFNLRNKLQMISSLNYKQSLTNFAGLGYHKQKPYTIGARLSVIKRI